MLSPPCTLEPVGGSRTKMPQICARSSSLRGVVDRPVLALAALCSVLLVLPTLVAGQNPPPPAQAAAALQQAVSQNPGLADVIRQRIGQSGMTPDQIRARLQASGYPPTLLDAYLGAQTPGQPSPVPGAQRSEEHTSELQSQSNLVCRLLLEKKKKGSPPV